MTAALTFGHKALACAMAAQSGCVDCADLAELALSWAELFQHDQRAAKTIRGPVGALIGAGTDDEITDAGRWLHAALASFPPERHPKAKPETSEADRYA